MISAGFIVGVISFGLTLFFVMRTYKAEQYFETLSPEIIKIKGEIFPVMQDSEEPKVIARLVNQDLAMAKRDIKVCMTAAIFCGVLTITAFCFAYIAFYFA